MRIGFYFNDKGFSNKDLRNPSEGNCGIGGTQYCFLMVGDALCTHSNHEILFYHYQDNILPEKIKSILVKDSQDLIEKAQEDQLDFLIYKTEGVTPFVQALRNVSFDCIAWAHNYIFDRELAELQENPQIKRIVFVGKEQYDRYIDHKAIQKCTYIYNMFDGRLFEKRKLPEIPTVTYTGSLVKPKGFHILASVWKDVLKQVPEAQLYVIGNGQLYNEKEKLGSLGIAQEAYEKSFANFIQENGRLLPSVHFCGSLGKEKTDIYAQTSVGVMNPSGKTETFGLSAIEMEACGIPVVSKASNGLFDTIHHEKTGLLVKNKKQLTQAIVELLVNKEKNEQFGKSAKHFADTAFLPEKIVQDWLEMFEEIKSGKAAVYHKPVANFGNNVKWLRILNKNIPFGISILEWECMARSVLYKLVKR